MTAALLVNGPLVRLCQARWGLMAYPANDVYVGRSFEAYGEYCEQEQVMMTWLLKPGDVVVEAGANIGAFTIPLAKRVGPTGKVHAFEPQRAMFNLLTTNVVLNQLSNVELHKSALGMVEDVMDVPLLDLGKPNNFGALSLAGSNGAQVNGDKTDQVEVVRLDSLRLPRLHLLKADVEGMEEAIVHGARDTIKRCRPFLYLEADRGERREGLISALRGLNYDIWRHHPPLFSPANFAGEAGNVFGDLASINILATPSERHLEPDLERVP